MLERSFSSYFKCKVVQDPNSKSEDFEKAKGRNRDDCKENFVWNVTKLRKVSQSQVSQVPCRR